MISLVMETITMLLIKEYQGECFGGLGVAIHYDLITPLS